MPRLGELQIDREFTAKVDVPSMPSMLDYKGWSKVPIQSKVDIKQSPALGQLSRYPSHYKSTSASMNELQSQSPSPAKFNTGARPGRKKVVHLWRCFWLTFLVVSLAYAWYSFYVPSNSIAWADNYASAQHQAAESGKPIILYFSGEWCSPCRVMKRQVWADEEVKTLVNSEYIPVAIEVGNSGDDDILARYNVNGAPVTIITDPQGNALRWRVGGISKTEFLELLGAANPDGEIEM